MVCFVIVIILIVSNTYLYHFSDSAECLQYLVGCFHTLYCTQSESTSIYKQHMWVLKVMGHVRNLTTGVVPITGLEAAQVRM